MKSVKLFLKLIKKSVEIMNGLSVGLQAVLVTCLTLFFGVVVQPYVSMAAIGGMTFVVSIVGGIVAFKHFWYFRGTKIAVAQKLRQVFLTDMSIYIVTIFFGIGAILAFDQHQFWWGYYLRLIAFSLNIWASVRLFIHYLTEAALVEDE